MIDAPTRVFLNEYFRKITLQERATIVALGFLQTHAHLLVRTGPRFDLPRLVQLLKGGSSYAASRQPRNVLGLRWNREYSRDECEPEAPAPSGRVHPGSGRPAPLRSNPTLKAWARYGTALQAQRFTWAHSSEWE